MHVSHLTHHVLTLSAFQCAEAVPLKLRPTRYCRWIYSKVLGKWAYNETHELKFKREETELKKNVMNKVMIFLIICSPGIFAEMIGKCSSLFIELFQSINPSSTTASKKQLLKFQKYLRNGKRKSHI